MSSLRTSPDDGVPETGTRRNRSEERSECEQYAHSQLAFQPSPKREEPDAGFRRLLQEVNDAGQYVASATVGALEVFHSTVEVMLMDGVLTREEKRLIIKLASALQLNADEPAEVYRAIQEGRTSDTGRIIEADQFRHIYTQVFEVAIVNASLSKDEFRVLAHLRSVFNIDNEMHSDIEQELRDMVQEKYEDNAMIDTLMTTLRDSVGMVGDLFDSLRRRPNDGDRR